MFALQRKFLTFASTERSQITCQPLLSSSVFNKAKIVSLHNSYVGPGAQVFESWDPNNCIKLGSIFNV